MFNSNLKLWIQFWNKIGNKIYLFYTPVIGWEKTINGEYVALVLAPDGGDLNGCVATYANAESIKKYYGNVNQIILEEFLKEDIEDSEKWRALDIYNREVHVYPKRPL